MDESPQSNRSKSPPPDVAIEDDEEINEASQQPQPTKEPEADANSTSLGLDGAADNALPTTASPNTLALNGSEVGPTAETEARIPAKKDTTLREFLGRMDDYAPIIPDAVTNHYLTLAGLPPPPQTPPHLARLLALATQKFVADIAADAYQYARIRSSHTTSNTANAMASMPGGGAGGTSGAGAAGATAAVGGKDGDKTGGVGTKQGLNLGVQRPGFGGGGGQGTGQARTVLTMEDLGMAVGEYGVNVKRGEFYR